MKNSMLRRKMYSLSILLTALLYSSASFADLTITAEVLVPTTVHAAYSHTFTATGTDAPGATWQINPADIGMVNAYGLTFNAATHTLSGPASMPFGSPGLQFRVDAVNGSAADEKTFFLIINRLSIDLMIVLDKSGSMGWSFDGSNFSAPMGQRRYDGLITGVSVMSTGLNNPMNLLPNDRMGLRYFESTPFTPPGTFNPGLIQMNSANLTALNSEVQSRGPGTNTALGDGILTGKSVLLPGTPGNRKAMIVFSDGIQNAGDQVKTTGAGAYRQTMSNAELSRSGGTDSFPINTICLGSSGDNPTLMENIALNNGNGEYFNSLAGDNNDFIMNSFLGSIQNILSGSSPEYVDVRTGTFKPDSLKRLTLQESFTVNKSVSSVFVVLATGLPAEIISVKKDGVELNQYIHSSGGQGFHSFYINLPIPSLPSVKPDGEWKISAVAGFSDVATVGTGSPNYTISMTVEDHLNHLSFSVGGRDYKVGDVLRPEVSFKRAATPYSSAAVQAIVVKPGDDINDLLARSDIQFTNPSGDSSTPNVGKLAQLMKDSAFLARIKAANRLVNLTYDAGTGRYTGSFPELDIAGVYRVIYRITSNDTVNGVVNRYYLKSFNVRFKDVDMANSNVAALIDSITHNAIIVLRPISSTGKFIGPGWGSSIGLNAPGLKIQRVDDMGDGTYKVHLDGPLAGNGIVTIANDTIYNGPLGDITKGGGGGGGPIFGHWWFWLILLLILILIILALRKKKP